MPAIQIFLNGEPREAPESVDLDNLLDLFSLPKQRVAVELNSTVVRRSEWGETLVSANDKIEVVHFVGGG